MERYMRDEHWADAYEPSEEAADAARALELLRELERLARLHCWREALPLLLQIECAIPDPEE